MAQSDDPGSSFEATLPRLISAVAADAGKVLAEHPEARIVGLVAERGTVECKRVRTMLEQGTGNELDMQTFGGIVPIEALSKILDTTSFPTDALEWMMKPERESGLHIIVCGRQGVRVVSMKRPGSS
jgi:hypothetical protein